MNEMKTPSRFLDCPSRRSKTSYSDVGDHSMLVTLWWRQFLNVGDKIILATIFPSCWWLFECDEMFTNISKFPPTKAPTICCCFVTNIDATIICHQRQGPPNTEQQVFAVWLFGLFVNLWKLLMHPDAKSHAEVILCQQKDFHVDWIVVSSQFPTE